MPQPLFSSNFSLTIDYFKPTFKQQVVRASDVISFPDHCPVCEGAVAPLAEVGDEDKRVILRKSICLDCTYTYFSSLPNEGWFENFYKNQWDSGAKSKGPRLYNPTDYNDNIELIKEFAPARSAKLLDVGAGYGNFLQRCRNEGYTNLRGVDASQRRADFCCSDARNLNVSQGTIEAFGASTQEKFDVVHSHAVIEHVYDINKSIDNIRNMLNPNGIAVITVPDAFDEHFLLITHCLLHIRNFTKKSLVVLFDKRGFQVEKIIRSNRDFAIVARKVENPDNSKLLASMPSSAEIVAALENKFFQEYRTRTYTKGGQVWGATGIPRREKILFRQRVLFAFKSMVFGLNGASSNSIQRFIRKVANRLSPYFGSEFGGKLTPQNPQSRQSESFPLVRVFFADGFARALMK